MSQSTFSLSWEAHRSNICKGLSVLQQNEEFVDMTLAADGHFVKVHQMIMALSSPYFKDLISSAGDRHPVIFLNKISYTTLSAILEYIYTGEVLISIDNLSELIQTAKELHIKGLEDMKLQNSIGQPILSLNQETSDPERSSQDDHTENRECSEMDEICYFEITDRVDTQSQKSTYSTVQYLDDGALDDSKSINMSEVGEKCGEISPDEEESEPKSPGSCGLLTERTGSVAEYLPSATALQYTVSNQGSIQMILNRYVYYLKHCNRNSTRQWRCVDYLNKRKCPAIVMTKGNMVLNRLSAHIHSHHDKRILKKVQAGAIFTAITDAEKEGQQIKIKVIQEKMERETQDTSTT